MRLGGRPARLDAIDCPLLAVTFEHDHIVPVASAAPLVEQVSSPDKARLHLDGGHVGAVVSRKASRTLWPQLSQWWADRDTDADRGLDAEQPHDGGDPDDDGGPGDGGRAPSSSPPA